MRCWGLFASLLGATAIYLYLAIGRSYAEKGLGRAMKVLVLTMAVGTGILGYRFTVFLITLYWS